MKFKDVDNNPYYKERKVTTAIEKRHCKICGIYTSFKRVYNGHYVCSSECLEVDEHFDEE